MITKPSFCWNILPIQTGLGTLGETLIVFVLIVSRSTALADSVAGQIEFHIHKEFMDFVLIKLATRWTLVIVTGVPNWSFNVLLILA